MAIGANPLGARSSVAPMITIRKNAVNTTSATNPASSGIASGRMSPVTVGGEARVRIEAGGSARNVVEHARRRDRSYTCAIT